MTFTSYSVITIATDDLAMQGQGTISPVALFTSMD